MERPLGAADQNLKNSTQRLATSRDAAVAAAQHELLTIIKGARVEGGITTEKAMETDSRITTSLNDVIRGAEITKTEWTKDDGCVITMRIAKKNVSLALGVDFQ